MRRYETIFIVDPDLSDEERPALFKKITDLIPKQDGLLVVFDEWGARKLAYEIKKTARGYYVRLDYCGTGALVDEIERIFRIDDRVLKYMTVMLEKDVDIEKIKEEVIQKEAKDDQSDKVDEPEIDQEPTEILESEAVVNDTNQPKSEEEEL